MGVVNVGPQVSYEVAFKEPTTQKSEWAMFSIKRVGGYSFDIGMTRWPTGNCQVASVAYMGHLLHHTGGNKASVNAVIKECFKMLGMIPLLILMDVKQQYCAGVEACLSVQHKHPYISTNGSAMCLYLVRLGE